jgi:carbon-monoxide dehydrogenase medium subunit
VKPAPFEYDAPATIDAALDLLAEFGDDSKVLAGGQSLIPMLAMRLARFDHLIDINGVAELADIKATNGGIRCGASVRQATVEHDLEVARLVPLLSRATPLIAHFQIRNLGTIGGSIAHADPASELPAVAVTLGATMHVAGPQGCRPVAALDFFQGTWEVDIRANEILAAIDFPAWSARSGYAIEEVARRHGDFALAGVACAVTLDRNDVVQRAGFGLFGVGSTPIAALDAVHALEGRPVADIDITEIARLATASLEPPEDLHATRDYRRAVATYMVETALRRALQEAVDVR